MLQVYTMHIYIIIIYIYAYYGIPWHDVNLHPFFIFFHCQSSIANVHDILHRGDVQRDKALQFVR